MLIKQNGERIYNPKIKGLSVKFLGGNNIVKLYEPLPNFINCNFTLLYKNKMFNTKILGFKDRFFDHGNRLQILQDAGLSSEQIANAVKELADA